MAVHELGGLKTAGPDSFHSMFYQRCWDTINNFLASVVFEFSDQGSLALILNSTNLVLILKVPNSVRSVCAISPIKFHSSA